MQDLMQRFSISRAGVYRAIYRINDGASFEVAKIKKELVVLSRDTPREALAERKKLVDHLIDKL